MEKIKKIPQRKCVGCGERRDKGDLWRVVKSPDGAVSLDKTGKVPGRGAYICHSVACLKKAIKAHRLESNLECAIPEEVYAALESAMSEEQ
ncbi:MAG: YlxR family protein [Oscillospiraceae bacterium]|nr:YlxR family protein [Clostridia bacterium]MBQ9857939.1 YlxR family protein [Oscillospiraceae bacterium]